MNKNMCLLLYVFFVSGYVFCYGAIDDLMSEFGDFDVDFEKDFASNPEKDSDNGLEKDVEKSSKEELDSSTIKDFADGLETVSDSGFGNVIDNPKKDSETSFEKDVDNGSNDELKNLFGDDFFDSLEKESENNFEKHTESDLEVGPISDSEKDVGSDLTTEYDKALGGDLEDINSFLGEDSNTDCNDDFGIFDENCIEGLFTTPDTDDQQGPIKKCNMELKGEFEKMMKNKLKDVKKSEPFDIEGELRVALFMTIHDGKMTGLSTLTNVTETKYVCTDNNTMIRMNTTLRMTNPKINYKWTRVGPLGFTQKGTFWIKAEVIDFYIEIALNTTNERKVTRNVTATLLAKAEDFTMKFEGLWVFDYVVNFWIQTIFGLFKLRIKTAIEGLVKLLIEQKVDIIVRLHNNPIFK